MGSRICRQCFGACEKVNYPVSNKPLHEQFVWKCVAKIVTTHQNLKRRHGARCGLTIFSEQGLVSTDAMHVEGELHSHRAKQLRVHRSTFRIVVIILSWVITAWAEVKRHRVRQT